MKRLLAVLLSVIMLTALIVGCGKTEQTENGENTSGISEDTQPLVVENQQEEESGGSVQQNDDDKSNVPIEPLSVTYPELPSTDVGFGSTEYGFCKRETYILKDYNSEITIPECPDLANTDSLSVYTQGGITGEGALRQRCEAFLECIGEVSDSFVTTEVNDTVYQGCLIPGKNFKVNGSRSDNTIQIRSLDWGFFVRYISDTEIREGDIEFIKQYIKDAQVISAACAYSQITEPELMYCCDYNIYGEPFGHYYICNAGDDGYMLTKKVVTISFGVDNAVYLFIKDQELFKEAASYPVRDMQQAISEFCTENSIDSNSILKTGFAYMPAFEHRQDKIYVPCYILLVPGDNEFIEMNMDLSVYQEYDVLAIPAVEIS